MKGRGSKKAAQAKGKQYRYAGHAHPNGYEVPEQDEHVIEQWSHDWNSLCDLCSLGGSLLCCDYCNLAFHLACLRPKRRRLPDVRAAPGLGQRAPQTPPHPDATGRLGLPRLRSAAEARKRAATD